MNPNIIGPINELGYGTVCLNYMLSLHKQGHKVSYFPIDAKSIQCPQFMGNLNVHTTIREWIENARLFDPKAPCLRIWHQFDMAQHVGYGPFYGIPIFELDTFTAVEKHHLASCEYIIVNSAWAKSVIIDQLNRASAWECRTKVVPLGIDPTIFKPAPPNRRKTTIFFAAGKWEVRKGHDILVKCFNKAFGVNDDVQLQLLCNNPFLNEEQAKTWVAVYEGSELGRKIVVLPRAETHYDVARIMAGVDCGVFLSRAEGWNLELLEMMAMGKRVIATNCTAHTEYCTPENAMLVDTHGLEPAQDGIWFYGQGNWHKLTNESVDQVVEHMRAVHKLKQDGGDMTNYAGALTAEQFTWDKAAAKLAKEIEC